MYLINLGLLYTHEIDAAFWKEWELLGIPGGIQLFLVLNFFLILLTLFGFRQLLLLRSSGYAFSLLLAASGIFAFSIHSYFILTGHPQFQLPVSFSLLLLTLIVSLLQGYFAVTELRIPKGVN